jgi:hypothetical protein
MAAVSLALLAQGAIAAEEQFFPVLSYRVGPYGANGQSFFGGFVDYLNYVNLKENGIKNIHVEGLPNCDWVLIDSGDVIVHVFRPEVREFYNLERLYTQGPGAAKAI